MRACNAHLLVDLRDPVDVLVERFILALLACDVTYQDRPMYLIRAVTVHSNRPKEVWFGPSAYTARILWSGGKFFLIEGPQRPPPGLSGLHVVPPLPSPAAYVRPSPCHAETLQVSL